MIALFLTFIIAAYFLGPDLVSRFILGFVCSRKNIVQSKGEEITRAVAWALLPLCIAALWAWQWGTLIECAGWKEWKQFLAAAYSDPYFEHNIEPVFHATKAVFWWNFAILWRMYFLVVLFWISIDLIIARYGRIRNHLSSKGWWAQLSLKGIKFFIIPRVSEWHVLLSSMLTESKDIIVHADILMKNDILYSGRVQDTNIRSDGELNSVILSMPRRFRRAEYMEAKKTGNTPKVEDYWVKIPGSSLIVIASDIISINVTHASPSALQKDSEIKKALAAAVATMEEVRRLLK